GQSQHLMMGPPQGGRARHSRSGPHSPPNRPMAGTAAHISAPAPHPRELYAPLGLNRVGVLRRSRVAPRPRSRLEPPPEAPKPCSPGNNRGLDSRSLGTRPPNASAAATKGSATATKDSAVATKGSAEATRGLAEAAKGSSDATTTSADATTTSAD